MVFQITSTREIRLPCSSYFSGRLIDGCLWKSQSSRDLSIKQFIGSRNHHSRSLFYLFSIFFVFLWDLDWDPSDRCCCRFEMCSRWPRRSPWRADSVIIDAIVSFDNVCCSLWFLLGHDNRQTRIKMGTFDPRERRGFFGHSCCRTWMRGCMLL